MPTGRGGLQKGPERRSGGRPRSSAVAKFSRRNVEDGRPLDVGPGTRDDQLRRRRMRYSEGVKSMKVHAPKSDVVSHPYRDLVAEAQHEREVADCPEAEALQIAICKAITAYSDFLEDRGVIWQDGVDPEDFPRLKAQALVVTFDYGEYDGVDIRLKDGALDRVYRNGVNPDPDGRGPRDIPRKGRPDDQTAKF
jgi:hypothetical protein